jgi:ADP-heptose:LPS heptosyltransferase
VPSDVLILRALGLGDLLAAVPALRALARAFPLQRRVLAAPAVLAPLLALIEFDGGRCVAELVDLRGLADPVAKLPQGAEVAVNLHSRGPESHRLLVATGPRRLVAFDHPDVDECRGGPEWNAEEHEVDRWCRMLRESGIEADPEELSIRHPATPVSPRLLGATLVHPGAADAARRWPAARWAIVARAEAEAGREVFLTGSASEWDLCNEVATAAGLGSGRVLAGHTDLALLTAVIGGAGALACGDTGVAHLASALGTPSVSLFGPTSPRHWGPPPRVRQHRPIWAGREGDSHGTEPDPGLLEIGPDVVIGELAALHAAAAGKAAG